jgi:succinylarginine dihydrolase
MLKKQSVLRLLDVTSSGIRKLYNRWLRITKKDRTLQQVNTTMLFADHLNDALSNNLSMIFKDRRTS